MMQQRERNAYLMVFWPVKLDLYDMELNEKDRQHKCVCVCVLCNLSHFQKWDNEITYKLKTLANILKFYITFPIYIVFIIVDFKDNNS